MARSAEAVRCRSALTHKVRPTARDCCEWRSTSMNANLEISREGGVLRVTLNRPDKRNALSAEMCRGIVDAVEGVQDDSSVGAVILDAKGDVFCAGMDLDEAAS